MSVSTATTGPATPPSDPRFAGTDPEHARAAVILLHGRGDSAMGILGLAPHLDPGGTAFVAPQAPGGSWYPASFLAPFERNEPYLSAALAEVRRTVERLRARGLAAHRVALAGFSQGACLALETAAREPRRYGAILAFTGGRIGPPGTPFEGKGSFEGTPVLLTAGDPDPHVPWWRVEETAAALTAMDAEVDLRRYPGRPHTITGDELAAAAARIADLASAG